MAAVPLSAMHMTAIPLSAVHMTAIPLSAMHMTAIPLSAMQMAAVLTCCTKALVGTGWAISLPNSTTSAETAPLPL